MVRWVARWALLAIVCMAAELGSHLIVPQLVSEVREQSLEHSVYPTSDRRNREQDVHKPGICLDRARSGHYG